MGIEIVTALIGVGATLLGFGLSEISTYIKRRKDEKERFLMANYTQRQTAYACMYTALIKYQSYFSKFIEYGNEFVEHEEPSNFGPLVELTAFRNTFEQNQIWLHSKTTEEINNVIEISSLGCNLAINIATEDNEMWVSAVEPMAQDVINKIEDIKTHIKGITGMSLLDGYQERITLKHSS